MNHRQKICMVIVFIGMFHFLLVVLFGDNGLLELHRKNVTYQMLLKDNIRMTQENRKMFRAIDRLQNDSTYVENIARQELGMIRSDELIFKFKSDPKDR